ncbi:MAG: SPFH domain-containing protein [Marinilabiliaceae bacterium]|nr:SPFH domain-containing protein [Marinilabiliaceae bacterium]
MKFGKLTSVLKWEDSNPDLFAWKHPEVDFNTKTRLIVTDSQEAIFRHNGQGHDIFAPGKYTLNTENLPLLNKLIKIPYGGASPFSAEVWFINKVANLNVGWGTQNSLTTEDPELNIAAKVKAYGQFGIKVDDPKKFLDQLVGTVPDFTADKLKEYFRAVLLQQFQVAFQQALFVNNISLLRVTAFLNIITEQVEKLVKPKFEEFGVRFFNFAIENVSLDSSSENELREIKKERADIDTQALKQQKLGYSYQQDRSFDVMQSAAENEGGDNGGGLRNDMMGMGIGTAMGMGMGQAMNNMMGSVMNPNDQKGNNSRPSLSCTSCNQPLAEGAKFCASCGQKAIPAGSALCIKCENIIPSGSKFCPECGSSQVAKCPNCQAELTPQSKFCGSCGEKVS